MRFAGDLAEFLVALRAVDPAGGPQPGQHSAFRGGPVVHWDHEMRDLLHRVQERDRDIANGIWRDALAASFADEPVWFHGDVAAANLLIHDGALSAVVDFGCAGVGDPACDTVALWTMFEGTARDVFRDALAVDEATWASQPAGPRCSPGQLRAATRVAVDSIFWKARSRTFATVGSFQTPLAMPLSPRNGLLPAFVPTRNATAAAASPSTAVRR